MAQPNGFSDGDTAAHAASAGDSWSGRIATRYHLTLPADLIDWWDREIWRLEGTGEFTQGANPADLLAPVPEAIWPALMPPDVLPLVGSRHGDWLCGRVDERGRVTQVIHWYHGGGDWIPWGNTLAEAILFDAMSPWLPGPHRRHAIEAEDPRTGGSPCGDDPLVDWALSHVSAELHGLVCRGMRMSGDIDAATRQAFAWELAGGLVRHGVAEVAVRCECVQAELQRSGVGWIRRNHQSGQAHPPGGRGTGATPPAGSFCADQPGRAGDPDDAAWESIADHCGAVIRISPELAWPWDLLGYAAQRRGDLRAAAESYAASLDCPAFTDQSIRLGTHFTSDRAVKFAAAMLGDLADRGVIAAAQDRVRAATGDGQSDARRRVAGLWREQAIVAERENRWEDALRGYQMAGWDVGIEPLGAYADLLQAIVRVATLAGQPGRAAVAQVHLDCFRDRYGD